MTKQNVIVPITTALTIGFAYYYRKEIGEGLTKLKELAKQAFEEMDFDTDYSFDLDLPDFSHATPPQTAVTS